MTLIAYEIVNRADPTLVDRIDLPHGDPRDRVMSGLVRKVDIERWSIRSVYSEPPPNKG